MKLSEDLEEPSAEYLLVLSPDGDYCFAIKELQKKLINRLLLVKGQVPLPHVTLLNFLMDPSKEAELCKRLTKAAQFIKPFEVKLSEFHAYGSHAFLLMQDKKPIMDIRRTIKDKLKRPRFSVIKYPEVTNPHLTLVKSLNESQCEDCGSILDERSLPISFNPSEMVLLKRTGNSPYKEVNRFEFLGMDPVAYIQTTLF